MHISELKNKVKQRIDLVNDKYLLEEILSLIDFESGNDEAFIIPTSHQKKLEISLEQMKKGDVIPNEEIDLIIKKRLSY
jgi:translation initiation factor 2 gamma subunit (eIF-2gamma)